MTPARGLPLRLLASALVVSLAVAAPATAQPPADTAFSVQVEGLAVIEQGNVAAARDRAVAEALQRAVERATATLVPPETLAQQEAALRARIYPDTPRFVRTYRIITEIPTGTLYHASVEVVVDREPLRQALVGMGVVSASAPVGPLGLLTVTARGATRHPQVVALTQALTDRGQAQRVRFRSLAPGDLTLEVETPLPALDLAAELSHLQVPGARVSVAAPDPRRVEVLFIPAR
jgi:hypothetical protein